MAPLVLYMLIKEPQAAGFQSDPLIWPRVLRIEVKTRISRNGIPLEFAQMFRVSFDDSGGVLSVNNHSRLSIVLKEI